MVNKIVALACTVFLAVSVHAQHTEATSGTDSVNASAATAAQSLADRFADMETMQAEFEQAIRDEAGEVLQEAKGRIVVQRPRKFYWHTEFPYEHLVVTAGETLWIYDVDLEQVSSQPYDRKLDRAPALILSGEVDRLNERYRISAEWDPNDVDRVTYVLKPKDSDGVFSALRLTFQGSVLSSMQMRDSFQQTTDIQFLNAVYNQPVAAEQFQFTPPDDVDVIRNDQ